jgi:alkylation response protein AidB-like acyl-CoA dehydrogenase
MDFSYPDTYSDIRKLAGEILSDHATPERFKKLEANGPYLDSALWTTFVESGLHAASLPEAIGGMGLPFSATTMVTEALGEAVVMIPYIPCIISTALPLLSVPAMPVISELLTSVVNGELSVTAFIEPGNEDPLSPRTTATQAGEGWQLNGTKHCVPYAANAGTVLMSATVNGELWAGLVPVQQKGVSLAEQLTTTHEPQYEITLNNANAHCVARGDAARALIEKSIAMTTVAYCSMACGVATRMTRIACDYTSQREQFGVAIATFQAVAHRLADCFIDTECLKIMTLQAVSDLDDGNDTAMSVSLAKVRCGDALHRISQATQHVHGGTGIDRDYHLWRYCLWAKFLELALGSSRLHLARIADRIEAEYLAKAGLA